jgi:hypothetical protein
MPSAGVVTIERVDTKDGSQKVVPSNGALLGMPGAAGFTFRETPSLGQSSNILMLS